MFFIADGRLRLWLIWPGSRLLRPSRRAGSLLGFFTAGASTCATSAAVSSAEELKAIDDNFVLAALGAAFFVIPRLILETPLHQQRLALLAIFIDRLGLFSEAGAIDEQDLFAVLALRGAPLVIDGQAEFDDRGLAGQIAHLRIA